MNIITVDGPSGSGKSSVAKILSQKIGYYHLDTGALYRALAYHILENKIDFNDEKSVEKAIENATVSVEYEEDMTQKTFLNGEDVSEKIRTEEISKVTSIIASYKGVRKKLLFIQRDSGEKFNLIVDGRDIGTQIFPESKFKYFVTASPEERAKRRHNQNETLGIASNYDEVLKAINERDGRDENRKVSPLKMADDALLVDTSEMDLHESVDFILKDFRMKQPKKPLTWWYKLVRAIVVFLFFLVVRVRIEGEENIPKTGGYIVSPNHKSLADVVLTIGLLKKKTPKLQPKILAKGELMDSGFMYNLFTAFGAHSVIRGKPTTEPLDWSADQVKSGEILLIFPEGTRSRKVDETTNLTSLLPPKSGVGLICAQAYSDVLPISIFFTNKTVYPFKKITARIGKIIKYEEFGFSEPLKSSERKKAGRTIMSRIEEMYVKGHS